MKTSLLSPLAFILLTVSCVSQQKYDELEKKVKFLEAQNTELHKTLTLYMENSTNHASSTYESGDEVKETPKIEFPKYAFVVLKVQEVDGWTMEGGVTTYKYKTYNFTSSVKEFSSFTEEAKYTFLDEVVNNYSSTNGVGGATSKEGKIYKRDCFVFNTYEEASKDREKYVLQ